jgi:hypothetical protein
MKIKLHFKAELHFQSLKFFNLNIVKQKNRSNCFFAKFSDKCSQLLINYNRDTSPLLKPLYLAHRVLPLLDQTLTNKKIIRNLPSSYLKGKPSQLFVGILN